LQYLTAAPAPDYPEQDSFVHRPMPNENITEKDRVTRAKDTAH